MIFRLWGLPAGSGGSPLLGSLVASREVVLGRQWELSEPPMVGSRPPKPPGPVGSRTAHIQTVYHPYTSIYKIGAIGRILAPGYLSHERPSLERSPDWTSEDRVAASPHLAGVRPYQRGWWWPGQGPWLIG